MKRRMSDPEPEAETISEEEAANPTAEIKKASREIDHELLYHANNLETTLDRCDSKILSDNSLPFAT